MANYGDSRFGQWADPNFGASLNGQGVLPAGGGSPSASSAASNFGSPSGSMIRDSSMPRDGASQDEMEGYWRSQGWNGQYNRGRSTGAAGFNGTPSGMQGFAEGGMIEDTDTGNAQSAASDPFSLITEAMNYGRKAYGVGQLFASKVREGFAGADKSLKSAVGERGRQQESYAGTGDDVAAAVEDEGGSGSLDNETKAFNLNNALGDMGPDEGIQHGDTFVPGQRKDTLDLAEGGMIPEGDEAPQTEEEAPQGGGASQQSAMAYLSGQGGVSPEVAQAMEQQVDPQGQMDPSERKLQAIQRTGAPDKAFALMQHYRGKFNAYSAFARAALQGAGGRPPNPMAAADALNQAYSNVPDGNSMHFTPTRGGMRVSVKPTAPKPPLTPDSNQFNADSPTGRFPTRSPNPKTSMIPEQQFEDGGEVYRSPPEDQALRDEPGQYDDTYQSPPEDQALRDEPAQSDLAKSADVRGSLSGAAGVLTQPLHQTLRDAVMSIPQLFGWMKEKGQFDPLVDNQGQPIFDENFNMETGVGTEGTGPGNVSAPYQPDFPTGGEPIAEKTTGWRTPTAKDAVREAINAEPMLRAQIHHIKRSLPYLSESGIREAAIAQAIGAYTKNTAQIERARVTGESNEHIAQLKVEQASLARQALEDGKNSRAAQAIAAKLQIAKDRGDQQMWAEQVKALRTIMGVVGANKPHLIDSPEKMNAVANELMKAHGLQTQQRPQGQPQGQAPAAQGAAPAQPQQTSGTGPRPPAPAPPGMKYQVNTSGTQWRLVPAQ